MKPHSVTGDGYILKTTRVYRNFRIAEEKHWLVRITGFLVVTDKGTNIKTLLKSQL